MKHVPQRADASARRRGRATPAVHRHTRPSRGAAAAARRKHRREQAPHGPCSPARGGAARELGRACQAARAAAWRGARCFDRPAHRAGQPPLVRSGAAGGRGVRGQVVTRAPRDGRYRLLQARQRHPRARHRGRGLAHCRRGPPRQCQARQPGRPCGRGRVRAPAATGQPALHGRDRDPPVRAPRVPPARRARLIPRSSSGSRSRSGWPVGMRAKAVPNGIARADAALYEAKRRGRNRISIARILELEF